jgi:lycopene beta-cyclase
MTALAESIAVGEYRVPTPFSKRLVFMDRVFNRALKTQPDHGVELFMATAKTLNGEQFARFMLGNSGLIEWAKVVLAMPKWPFIKSALKQLLSHD